jgi:hypothetical protein
VKEPIQREEEYIKRGMVRNILEIVMKEQSNSATPTVVARVLELAIGKSEELREREEGKHDYHVPFGRFQSRRPPPISIGAYLERVYRYAKCSEPCYYIGLIYLDRVIQKYQQLSLTRFNVHRYVGVVICSLMLTCIVIAIKFYDDTFCTNEFYSRVGGVSCVEMNQLEADLLLLLDYDLTVTSEQYQASLQSLEGLLAAQSNPLPSRSSLLGTDQPSCQQVQQGIVSS